MKREECEVTVVGSGPAGATAAAALAAAGISVVVLEKHASPTRKPCAGGVLTRAVRHLPAQNHIPWQDPLVTTIALTHSRQGKLQRVVGQGLLRTVLRAEFDGVLSERAEESGARVIRGRPVTHLEVREDAVVVVADGICLTAEVVVGADGANSLVARQCGMVRRLEREAALVMEIAPRDMRPFRHWAAIDWDSPHGGYSWILPKRTHICVGAGGPGADRHTLRECALDHFRTYSSQDYEVLSEAVGWVPLPSSDIDRALDRVLLVGDAAALVDPFTREGITWATWSGSLAAKAGLSFLRGKADSLQVYNDLLEESLLPELRAAKHISAWFYSDPGGALRLLCTRAPAWRAFCGLLSGQVTHRTLYRRLPQLAPGNKSSFLRSPL